MDSLTRYDSAEDAAYSRKASACVRAAGMDPGELSLNSFKKRAHVILSGTYLHIFKELPPNFKSKPKNNAEMIQNCEALVLKLHAQSKEPKLKVIRGQDIFDGDYRGIRLLVDILFAAGHRKYMQHLRLHGAQTNNKDSDYFMFTLDEEMKPSSPEKAMNPNSSMPESIIVDTELTYPKEYYPHLNFDWKEATSFAGARSEDDAIDINANANEAMTMNPARSGSNAALEVEIDFLKYKLQSFENYFYDKLTGRKIKGTSLLNSTSPSASSDRFKSGQLLDLLGEDPKEKMLLDHLRLESLRLARADVSQGKQQSKQLSRGKVRPRSAPARKNGNLFVAPLQGSNLMDSSNMIKQSNVLSSAASDAKSSHTFIASEKHSSLLEADKISTSNGSNDRNQLQQQAKKLDPLKGRPLNQLIIRPALQPQDSSVAMDCNALTINFDTGKNKEKTSHVREDLADGHNNSKNIYIDGVIPNKVTKDLSASFDQEAYSIGDDMFDTTDLDVDVAIDTDVNKHELTLDNFSPIVARRNKDLLKENNNHDTSLSKEFLHFSSHRESADNNIENQNKNMNLPVDMKSKLSMNRSSSRLLSTNDIHLGKEARYYLSYDSMQPMDILISIEHSYNSSNRTQYTTAAEYSLKVLSNLVYDCCLCTRIGVVSFWNHTDIHAAVCSDRGRVGAFEIQVAYKNQKNELIIELLHSKLETKSLPTKTILPKRFLSFLSALQVKTFSSSWKKKNPLIWRLENTEKYSHIKSQPRRTDQQQPGPAGTSNSSHNTQSNLFHYPYYFCSVTSAGVDNSLDSSVLKSESKHTSIYWVFDGRRLPKYGVGDAVRIAGDGIPHSENITKERYPLLGSVQGFDAALDQSIVLLKYYDNPIYVNEKYFSYADDFVSSLPKYEKKTVPASVEVVMLLSALLFPDLQHSYWKVLDRSTDNQQGRKLLISRRSYFLQVRDFVKEFERSKALEVFGSSYKNGFVYHPETGEPVDIQVAYSEEVMDWVVELFSDGLIDIMGLQKTIGKLNKITQQPFVLDRRLLI